MFEKIRLGRFRNNAFCLYNFSSPSPSSSPPFPPPLIGMKLYIALQPHLFSGWALSMKQHQHQTTTLTYTYISAMATSIISSRLGLTLFIFAARQVYRNDDHYQLDLEVMTEGKGLRDRLDKPLLKADS